MGTGSTHGNIPLVADSRPILDCLKLEVAEELNMPHFIEAKRRGYAGHLTTGETGTVGGHMVRKMVKAAKHAIEQPL